MPAMSSLGFELTVALRFLREGRFQSLLILVGVAAGVAVVTYITALVAGLQGNTLNKTLGAQAHVVIKPQEERVQVPRVPGAVADARQRLRDEQPRAQRLRSLPDWPVLMARLERQPGLVAVSPMVSGAALARRAEATRSISVLGVELERYDGIVDLRSKLVQGEFRMGPGEALLGSALAADLGLRVGDRFNLSNGSRGEDLRLRGVVDLGARALNQRTVIVPLRSAQTLFDLAGGATQLDLKLADPWSAQTEAQALRRSLPHLVEPWQETNAQLVSALSAQSISTLLIRVVVMIVVVLGIASVLVVSVVQKQREIGILRAMGAMRGQILRVFLLQGALVGAFGSVLGVGLAQLMIWAFTTFVRIDGQPLFAITLEPATAARIAALALVAGVLAALAPARRASRMDPAQAIRL